MPLPVNIIANADDLGLNHSVNTAITYCFEKGYINSASLLTNTPGFGEAILLIHQNESMQNIGIHVNMAEGKPVTNVKENFLDANGNWDITKTNKKLKLLNRDEKKMLTAEIYAQIDMALSHTVKLTHIDSHYHLHTLPAFYDLFINAAAKFNLKLRLAQTYREGSYLKYAYRRYMNNAICSKNLNYTRRFETVEHFLNTTMDGKRVESVEVMLHPDLDENGNITDHFDKQTMVNWLNWLNTNGEFIK